MTAKTITVKIVHEGVMSAIPVPFDPKEVFGKTRAPVKVTLKGYTFRSTIASMGRRCWILAIVLMLGLPGPVSADELKPFTSDGCSSFPDGTPSQQDLWLDCCTAHDRAYWKGGTYQERLDADLELRSCVAQVNEPEIAAVMLVGVRVGGSPIFPTRFRWGYGWSWPRWYGPLTADELQQVEAAQRAEQAAQ